MTTKTSKKEILKTEKNNHILTAAKLESGTDVARGEQMSPEGIKGFLNLISQFVTVGGDFA